MDQAIFEYEIKPQRMVHRSSDGTIDSIYKRSDPHILM